jgi:hypothetical protein
MGVVLVEVDGFCLFSPDKRILSGVRQALSQSIEFEGLNKITVQKVLAEILRISSSAAVQGKSST